MIKKKKKKNSSILLFISILNIYNIYLLFFPFTKIFIFTSYLYHFIK